MKAFIVSYDALKEELAKLNQALRINQIDKNLLIKVSEIFQIFTEVFNELECSREPTLNKVIPMIETVKEILYSNSSSQPDTLLLTLLINPS